MEKTKYNLFLSYSKSDSQLFKVPLLAEKLEFHRFIEAAWYFERDAKEDWVKYMDEKLGKTDYLLLFCTPNALDSSHVENEWRAMYAKHKDNPTKIIPIFIEEKYIPTLLK
ncbi:MAG: toll/interleukin-1 receptor domain-containing protein [Promethearchaeota archaeon]|nr:MAG: toll/interleukin-1 receptor domain-containing protein [Candidatus Lokiarchaeota archaeon]